MVSRMFILKNDNYTSVSSFIHQVEVAFHHFDLERCDEKTLYVTVKLNYGTHKVLCDFIYIIDQQEIYGAISINKHYEKTRVFIQQHFQQFLFVVTQPLLERNGSLRK